jgi:hypothetical protein
MTSRATLCIVACGAAFSLLVACAPGDSGGSGPAVRDSAGIEIVENRRPLWADSFPWRLSDRPLVDISGRGDDPDGGLYRVSAASRLSDGRIVVANSGTGALHFYDGSGAILNSVGRLGGGPGEFRTMTSLGVLPGDSLAVYDRSQQRLTIFGPDGSFAKSFRPEGADKLGTNTAAAFLSDGTLVISAEGVFGSEELGGGLRRPALGLVRYDMMGVVLDTIVQVPGRELYLQRLTVEGRTMAVMAQLGFGHETRFAVHGNAFYLGTTDAFELRHYDGGGTLTRIVRLSEPPRPVTPADIELFLTEQLADTPDGAERDGIERFFAGMPFPDEMPAHGDILVDADGYLWVEEYRWPLDQASHWRVFDAEGAWLGTVVTPPRLQLYEIGHDYVLGRWRDDLDVEHVLLYELMRS